MGDIFELYAWLDPLVPLDATEVGLYVDWQAELGLDDVKPRLETAVALSHSRSSISLFTGHRGTGKTTELQRIAKRLRDGVRGRRFFAVVVEAEEWNDAELTAEEIVLQVAIRLVHDLEREGFRAPVERARSFLGRLVDWTKDNVALAGVDIGLDPVTLSLQLQQNPAARDPLRQALQANAPSLAQLVNGEILDPAKSWLADRQYDDVFVIVDQLDRIPLRMPSGEPSNHELLFCDQSGPLRNLHCGLLYTIPIELAYSRCRTRLEDIWGTRIVSLPVLPVVDRGGEPVEEARAALREIVQLRVKRAGFELPDVLEDPSDLQRLIALSGGHVRSLFLLLTGAVTRNSGRLPIPSTVIETTIRTEARDRAKGLRRSDWALLDQVRADRSKHDEDDAWYELLKNFYVLAYEDDEGEWYDAHPLHEHVRPPGMP